MIVDRDGNQSYLGEDQDRLLKRLYGTLYGRMLVRILILSPITHLIGKYMDSKYSIRHISPFIEKNNIDMSIYEEKAYISYNDFFTRKILPEQRPFDKNKNSFISPADAKVSYYPITNDSRFTIKDTPYTVQDLLQDESIANEYMEGICLVFRLTVDDYHRFGYVDTGKIIHRKFIKGKFHTVNPIANDYYPIYKQNTREYMVIDTDNFGQLIQMEVGAMMVGRIVNNDSIQCQKGKEKGFFEFGGSTVVVLVKQGQVEIDQDIIQNSLQNIETKVKYGETIGHKLEA